MEMLLSLCSSTASQEGEQRGDELGPRGDLRLLQKPQHPPLRAARCHCSWHWEGQSVNVRLPILRPPSISPSPSQTHSVPPRFLTHTTPLPLLLNLGTLRTLRELLKRKKRRNHYIFIRPAISTVCWAHDCWWAYFYCFVKRLHFWFLHGCLIWNVVHAYLFKCVEG